MLIVQRHGSQYKVNQTQTPTNDYSLRVDGGSLNELHNSNLENKYCATPKICYDFDVTSIFSKREFIPVCAKLVKSVSCICPNLYTQIQGNGVVIINSFNPSSENINPLETATNNIGRD